MGTAVASGDNCAVETAKRALASLLLDGARVNGADRILLSLPAANNFRVQEIYEVFTLVQRAARHDARISLGSICDPSLGDSVKVTLIVPSVNPSNRPLSLTDALPARRPAADP
jgi:cell division protein FtsZ